MSARMQSHHKLCLLVVSVVAAWWMREIFGPTDMWTSEMVKKRFERGLGWVNVLLGLILD